MVIKKFKIKMTVLLHLVLIEYKNLEVADAAITFLVIFCLLLGLVVQF